MHPLYHHAVRLQGQSVHVHHVSGHVYHGLLQSVTPHGIYLMPYRPGTRLTSSSTNRSPVLHAVDGQSDSGAVEQDVSGELVFFPALFFGFGALTGLAAGSALAYAW
jgi:hypothetical protein